MNHNYQYLRSLVLIVLQIGDAHLGSRPVIAVNKEAVVIEAFRVMDTSRRSGVALTDNNGRLVGTTTGKDLGVRSARECRA